MSNQPTQEAIDKGWREYSANLPICWTSDEVLMRSCEIPAYKQGFKAGFKHAESMMRKALKGHPQSELWGENGLIAATMRCVEEVQEIEDNH